ncbi:MAG: DUF5989 family protein [Microthrixaceae bacterium]
MHPGLRAKHAIRLVGDLWAYSRVNGAPWMLPLVIAMLFVGLLVTTTHLAVPAAVYTLI